MRARRECSGWFDAAFAVFWAAVSAARTAVVAAPILLAGCSPALDWREVRAEDGAFAVLLPAKPGRSERSLATPAGPVTMRMLVARSGETVLGAGVADFAVAPDAGLADALRDALLRNIGGRITAERAVTQGGASGREIAAAGQAGGGANAAAIELRARLLFKGQRYYQVAAVGRKGDLSEADIDMFLASFRPN
jgi:hypothetical protein